MKVEEILKNAPKDVSKDVLMRYLYLELGKIYRRDTRFFYGTDEEKEKIYNQEFDLNGKNIDIIDFILQHISEFEKMQGYIELKKCQREIFGKMLNKAEREKIKIHNLCPRDEDKTNMKSVIQVSLDKGNIYYVTQMGTNEFRKMNAEQMLEYMENEEWHFLKEKRNLDRPEERE